MNWADFTIIGIVALSALISVIRGFIKEALSMLAWVAAFAVSMLFYERVANTILSEAITTPSLRYLAAWAGLFVLVLLAASLVNYLIGKMVEATGLSGTDRLLGSLFGIARGMIIVMAILVMLPSVLPVQEDLWWHQSVLIPEFLRFEDWAREMAAWVSDWFKQLL
ncbi:MAG: CvpA family protein [Porticoccaceae bacterium]|nr:CvpA family protein [Porticoccaceae bacterium]